MKVCYFLIVGVMLGLLGCGGAPGGTSRTGPGVTGTVNSPTAITTSSQAVSSPAGVATRATFVVGNKSISAGILGGETIPASSQVYLVPDMLPVAVTIPQVTPNHARTTTLEPGALYILKSDGSTVPTGLHLSSNHLRGQSNESFDDLGLAFPPSGSSRKVSLILAGPMQVGSGETVLKIKDYLKISFELSNDADLGPGSHSTYPIHTEYVLPQDGGTTFNSLFLAVFDSLPAGVSVPATLTVEWPGVTKTQTRTSSRTQVYLFDGSNTGGAGDAVPTDGILRATLSIGNF